MVAEPSDPPSFAFDGNRIKGYPKYNPAEAAADVGALPGGKLNFTFTVQNTPTEIQQAEAIQAELQAIPGITVTLNAVSLTVELAARHAETFQASLANSGGSPVLPDPDFVYYRNFYSGSSQNHDGYSDPTFDSLVVEARETFSEPQRKKLYEEAQ